MTKLGHGTCQAVSRTIGYNEVAAENDREFFKLFFL